MHAGCTAGSLQPRIVSDIGGQRRFVARERKGLAQSRWRVRITSGYRRHPGAIASRTPETPWKTTIERIWTAATWDITPSRAEIALLPPIQRAGTVRRHPSPELRRWTLPIWSSGRRVNCLKHRIRRHGSKKRSNGRNSNQGAAYLFTGPIPTAAWSPIPRGTCTAPHTAAEA